MRKNKIYRRLVPTILSMLLIFNTGVAPIGALTMPSVIERTADDGSVNIEEVSNEAETEEATEAETEEVTEDVTEETEEESEEEVPENIDEEILDADGATPIYGDINVANPKNWGAGEVVFCNPRKFEGEGNVPIHVYLNGVQEDSPQIMYYHEKGTNNYVPIYCVEPGVALEDLDDGPGLSAKELKESMFDNLSEQEKRDFMRALGYCTPLKKVVTYDMDFGQQCTLLTQYWVNQYIVWYYLKKCSDKDAKRVIATFGGEAGYADFCAIKRKIETQEEIPSYAVKTTGGLSNSVRYKLQKDSHADTWSTVIEDANGMINRFNKPTFETGLAFADAVTFERCNRDGTLNENGNCWKITSTKEFKDANGATVNPVIKQTKKADYAAISSGSVYFQNGSQQDCVALKSGTETIPCYFSLATVDQAFVHVEKVATTSYGRNFRTYDYSGATYGIYTNPACTVEYLAKPGIDVFAVQGDDTTTGEPSEPYLVCNADGISNSVALKEGSYYYVKEIKAGYGFMLDPEVYRVRMDEAGSTTITSKEVPVADPIRLNIYKTDAEGIEMIQSGGKITDPNTFVIGGASLNGAIFKIEYSDYFKDSPSDFELGTIGDKRAAHQYTWYIETKYDEKAKCFAARLDDDHLTNFVKGSTIYPSSPLIYSESGNPTIPLGTIFVSEVKAPTGYQDVDGKSLLTDKNGKPLKQSVQQIRPIEKTDSEGNYICATGAAAYSKSDNSGKYDSNGDLYFYTVPEDDNPILVDEQGIRGDFKLQKVDYEAEEDLDGVFFKITSSAGESHYIMTRSDGSYNSKGVPHSQDTNYYDRYFDSEGNYIGPKNTSKIKEYTGLWFYGTSDQSMWDTSKIDNDKGALRYDETYMIEEMPGPNNQGKQLYSGEFSITEDTVIDLGIIFNYAFPYLESFQSDMTTHTHDTLGGKGIEVSIQDEVKYYRVQPDKTYTMKGILLEIDKKNKVVGPLKDVDGNIITASKVFKSPEKKDLPFVDYGLELEFNCKLDVNPGTRYVIYDYLYEGKNTATLSVSEDGVVDSTGAVAVHEEPNNEDQIGTFSFRGRVHVFKTGPFLTRTNAMDEQLPNGSVVTVNHLVYEQKEYAGIEFTVFDAETDEAVTSFVTGSDGVAMSDYIPYTENSKYYVLETNTPAGLVQSPEKYDIDFTEFDSEDISFFNKPIKVENQVCAVELGLFKQGDVLVPSKKGDFDIVGQGLAGVYIGIFNSEAISNNVGDVIVEAGTLVGLARTDQNGKAIVSEKLVAGKYYYQELCAASDEYALDPTRYDFELTYQDNSQDQVIYLNLNEAHPMYNSYKTQSVELSKVDDAGESIPGVEFDLYRLVEDSYSRIGHYVTDDSGKISIQDVPYGKYYFVETKGVDGFEFDGETHYEFEINDASITDMEIITLTAVNKRIPPTPSPKPPHVPVTGDISTPFVAILLLLLSFIVFIVQTVILKKNKYNR